MAHGNNTEGSNVGMGSNVSLGMNVNIGMPPGMQGAASGNTQQPVQSINPTTRALWIREWGYENPSRPLPCSAKAVYRLADSMYFVFMFHSDSNGLIELDLTDLKERAREVSHLQLIYGTDN